MYIWFGCLVDGCMDGIEKEIISENKPSTSHLSQLTEKWMVKKKNKKDEDEENIEEIVSYLKNTPRTH